MRAAAVPTALFAFSTALITPAIPSPAASPVRRPSGAALRVLITGDTRSYLRPCGCQLDSSGGLARRATLLSDLRSAGAAILLDAGNHVGAGAELRVDEGFVLAQLAGMGYDAAGTGPNDTDALTQLPPNSLPSRLPLICSNGGVSIHAPLRPAEVLKRGGVRVGVLCVCDSGAGNVGPAADPDQALREWVPKLRRRCDIVLVMSHLRTYAAPALAARCCGADIVISPSASLDASAVERAGTTWIAHYASLGRAVTEMTLRFNRGRLSGVEGSLHPLSPSVRDDERVARMVADHIRSGEAAKPRPLSDPKLEQSIRNLVAKENQVHDTCVNCHRPQVDHWLSTAHARAWATLVRVRSDQDPRCISCHTTPIPAAPAAPGLTGVGCATCHGVDEEHQRDPTGIQVARQPAATVCLSCHTPEQDPHFDFRSYLARVRH